MRRGWMTLLAVVALLIAAAYGFKVYNHQKKELALLEQSERRTTWQEKSLDFFQADWERSWREARAAGPDGPFPGWQQALTHSYLDNLNLFVEEIAEIERDVAERDIRFESEKKAAVAQRLRRLATRVEELQEKLRSGKGL